MKKVVEVQSEDEETSIEEDLGMFDGVTDDDEDDVSFARCGKYSFWGNLSILGNFLSILDNFWQFWTIFGHFLAIFGQFLDNFWTFQYYCARLPQQPYFPHCVA